MPTLLAYMKKWSYRYDPDANAEYIQFGNKKDRVSETIVTRGGATLIDFDMHGNIIGIEILR